METTPPNNDINLRVAQQLRGERAIGQLTLRELSDKTGISPATLMRYEKGEREVTFSAFHLIAGALGVDPIVLHQRSVER